MQRGEAALRHRPQMVRCAIYTRKSNEEGLDREFNSLDAQREACRAYILSQRHEGWEAVDELYDDGGFSGGNMDRPGLQQLLADVRAKRVDVIVVYKVDRLTRSLADFAKIVEILDEAGASFVSVTQSFNTTNSMGRLTLNVLLSFAQFEREVTGERIRDKIAASKKKGIWMGGPLPLGYDVRERKLIVNEAEAERVRAIFRGYLEAGTVPILVRVLKAGGVRTKAQRRSDGTVRGGMPFSNGNLLYLLRNVTYLGMIKHKKAIYPGEHEPIIPRDLWDAVQAQLASNTAKQRHRADADYPSLLPGLVWDGLGRRMTPSHTVKQTKRYRYYITHRDHVAVEGEAAWRVPAHDLEMLVVRSLRQLLGDPDRVQDVLPEAAVPPIDRNVIVAKARETAVRLDTASPHDLGAIVARFICRIDLHDDHLAITVSRHAIAEIAGGAISAAGERGDAGDAHVVTVPVARLRRGHEVRLVIPGISAAMPQNRNQRLIELIVRANVARKALLKEGARSISEAAAKLGHDRAHLTHLVRLSYLAPDIVSAILEGRQPAALTRKSLFAATHLPLSWAEQRAALGFA